MKKKDIMIISCAAVLTIALVYVVFNVILSRPSQTTLHIVPQTIGEAKGQDFAVNISISDVADLYGWQLRLRWNSTLLEAVNVTEGAFLRSSSGTLFDPRINNTAGYLFMICTLVPDIPGLETPGVNGSGTLATVQFHVRESGACELVLYETMLISSAEEEIIHSAINADFETIG